MATAIPIRPLAPDLPVEHDHGPWMMEPLTALNEPRETEGEPRHGPAGMNPDPVERTGIRYSMLKLFWRSWTIAVMAASTSSNLGRIGQFLTPVAHFLYGVRIEVEICV